MENIKTTDAVLDPQERVAEEPNTTESQKRNPNCKCTNCKCIKDDQ